MREERPHKAPFRVAYEIYSNPKRRYLANLGRKLAREEMRPARDFLEPDIRESTTEQEALALKDSHIHFFKSNAPTPAELARDQAIERQNYVFLKSYFDDKKRKLKLDKPLIFYDDEAMRIDVGYGPREFNMYFKDLDRLVKSKGIRNFGYSSTSLAGNKIVNMNEEYLDFLDNEKERLLKMADEASGRELSPKVKFPLEEDVTNEKIFLRKMMEHNRGLVIGEKHSERSAKEFLIDNMAYLKELGVTQIYMEHLLSERFQAMLDLPDMPQDLKAYLKYLDKEHDLEDEKGSFTHIVQAAKENGIRVIAIDSEAIYRIGYSVSFSDMHSGEESIVERFKAANMMMLECFKKFDDGNKYLVFTGSGHVTLCYGVRGMSDLLGCVNVAIYDSENENSVRGKLEADVDYSIDEQQSIHFDFLYHRSPVSEEFEQKKPLGFHRKMG